MRTFRTLCWWIFALGVLQFATWTGYRFEAATADGSSTSMHTFGVAWSPWLIRTCRSPVDRPLADCTEWRSEIDPVSVSALLLMVGIAAGVAAHRLRSTASVR